MAIKIKTICGPMCAGKSAKIIEIAGIFENNKINYVCLKPKSDHRLINGVSTKDRIISRGASLIAKAVELSIDFGDAEIKKLLKNNEVLIFDEVQFFDLNSIKKLIDTAKATDKKIQLIFAGLDMDFRGEEFETVKFVKSISNEIIMLRANCSVKGCENKATHSSKISGNKTQQVEIGGDNMYKPTCEKHHTEILNGIVFEFDK